MTTAFTEVSRDYDDLWLLTRDYRGWMLKKLLVKEIWILKVMLKVNKLRIFSYLKPLIERLFL